VSTIRAIADHYRLDAADVSLCVMPLFHVHGLVASVWAALAAGGSVVVPDRVSPRSFWSAVAMRHVTWYSASPTIHQMFQSSAPVGQLRDRPAPLRFVRSCSAALSPQLHEQLETFFGVPVLEAYGMTEASHQIASNPLPPAARFAGSVGRPTGTEIRVLGSEGADVEPGGTGEIVIRGPGIMPGYLGDDGADADAFLDGWFRTGDLGSVDSRGYVRLSGRLKELIIRGGENISPGEVEEVLLRHPSVEDAVCFGIPDVKYGEVVAAAVATTAPVTERELRDYCRAELAPFKVPMQIHVLDALPRTPTGKIQRRRMAALLEEAGH
jgi:acyl-CoA synthetase (AMP-forming)/AMP-acid ligase II